MNKVKRNRIGDSLRAIRSTRALATCAMLLALQLVLRLFISVDIGPSNRVNFSFIPLSMAAYLFGPMAGLINGALGDVLSYFLKPMGDYIPGLTLSAALTGFTYGLFFYRRRITFGRVALVNLVTDVLFSLLMNTFILAQWRGVPFIAMLLPRLIRNAAIYPVEVTLGMLTLPQLARIARPEEPISARPPRRALIALACVIVFALGIWANNTNLSVKRAEGPTRLLAHRGLSQTFPMEDIKWDTDTSKIIYPPEHAYLENTISSMERAFELGADIVELDVHRTKDDHLAVFHDYLLDYRTEAKGPVFDFTMDELKKLDVGYGYTADGGKTWPFRGKGVGLMPEISEVLRAFPDKNLLIHIKDEDERAGELLYEHIKDYGAERLAQISVYGDDGAMRLLKGKLPNLRVMSMDSLKSSMIQYELLGWTGYVPASLRGTQVHIPAGLARYLWGWPHKFQQRMDAVDTRVVLVNSDGGFSEGFDDLSMLELVPEGFGGYVWTNRIDRLKGEARDGA